MVTSSCAISAGTSKWWDRRNSTVLAEAIEDAATLDALARLERISWRIDRELEGWRYGPERDNQQMRHPDLIDFDDLSEESKDYDREMIRGAADIFRA